MLSKIFLLLILAGQIVLPWSAQKNDGQVLGVFDKVSPKEQTLPVIEVVEPEIIKVDVGSQSPTVTANSVWVIDKKTKFNFYEKNIDEVRSIASVTKLMAFLVLFDFGIDETQEVTIEAGDYHGGMNYLRTSEKLAVRDLVYLGLVASDNTAVSALARSTGLTEYEFIELMNQKADILGLDQTRFVDVTGLEAGSVSTARDLAILLKEFLKNERLAEVVTSKGAKITTSQRVFWIKSTNQLIADGNYNIKGGKTGFTDEAGGCLVFLSEMDGRDVYFIVLGSQDKESRFSDAKDLWTWVAENFEWE